MSWIGLDIGGANIKVAYDEDRTESVSFPLWKRKDDLQSKLRSIVSERDGLSSLAVTMTGELADCFESKEEGVKLIVEAVSRMSDDPLFFQTTGQFVPSDKAIKSWKLTAAANWCALAKFASKFMPNETGVLLDIGSTTTDIIPVVNGELCSKSRTDVERLANAELVYTGVTRSPINGLLHQVRMAGELVGVANEVFATTLDANVYLQNIKQSLGCTFTADGREATIRNSVKRLARVVCSDPSELEPEAIREIAEAAISAQKKQISRAIQQVIETHPEAATCFIVSGSGDWFARRIVLDGYAHIPMIELAKLVSSSASECAAAYAVRELAMSNSGLQQCNGAR